MEIRGYEVFNAKRILDMRECIEFLDTKNIIVSVDFDDTLHTKIDEFYTEKLMFFKILSETVDSFIITTGRTRDIQGVLDILDEWEICPDVIIHNASNKGDTLGKIDAVVVHFDDDSYEVSNCIDNGVMAFLCGDMVNSKTRNLILKMTRNIWTGKTLDPTRTEPPGSNKHLENYGYILR